VLLVMIENRLGKNLLCLAYSQCCGWRSVQTCVMVYHLGPSLAYSVSWLQSGHKMMTASFIQHMPVLKSLWNLSSFSNASSWF